MAFLTSRTLASGVTGDDLIHIVITGDTSQGNPDGSSYKANMNQVLTYFSQNFDGLTANTITANGVSANTISASTYLNLPGSSSANCSIDFYVNNLYGCPDVITFHDSYQSVDSNSSGLMSRSFGSYNNSYGDYSHTEGSGTTTISEYSHAEGFNTQAGFKAFSGVSASTIGYGVITLTGGTDYSSEFSPSGILLVGTINPFSIYQINYNSINYSTPNFEITLADNSLDGLDCEFVVDFNNLNSLSANTILGRYSHSEGFKNKALGPNSHSEGSLNKFPPNISFGEGSHSEGAYTKSYGQSSHSEGYETKTYGISSHSEGNNTKSYGNFSHSEGLLSETYGDNSHSEGYGSKSYGDNSHSEGHFSNTGWIGFEVDNITSGLITLNSVYGDVTGSFYIGEILITNPYGIYTFNPLNVSFSSGTNTQILLDDTSINSGLGYAADTDNLYDSSANEYISIGNHSEGYYSRAVGSYSHSEGEGNVSFGIASHSEGLNNYSYGNYSHTEGTETKTYGNYSHAEGKGTITVGDSQHVSGTYNLTASTDGAFIIGNGSNDLNRSNLLIASNDEVIISGLVGVGVTTIDTSAILQLDSTEKGFLPPRMLGTEAESISSPAEGLMVYITNGDGITITSKGWWGFDGTNWVKIGP